jgi:hypothetical protein
MIIEYGALGRTRISRGNLPQCATSSTTNSKWPDLGSKPNRRGGKPATNSLRYGTALEHVQTIGFKHVLGNGRRYTYEQ